MTIKVAAQTPFFPPTKRKMNNKWVLSLYYLTPWKKMLVFKNNKLSSLKYEHPSTQQRTEMSILALVLLCTPGWQDTKLCICAQQGPLERHLQDPRSAEKHCIRHGGMTFGVSKSAWVQERRGFSPLHLQPARTRKGHKRPLECIV